MQHFSMNKSNLLIVIVIVSVDVSVCVQCMRTFLFVITTVARKGKTDSKKNEKQ